MHVCMQVRTYAPNFQPFILLPLFFFTSAEVVDRFTIVRISMPLYESEQVRKKQQEHWTLENSGELLCRNMYVYLPVKHAGIARDYQKRGTTEQTEHLGDRQVHQTKERNT